MKFLVKPTGFFYPLTFSILAFSSSTGYATEAKDHPQVKELLAAGFVRLENAKTLTLVSTGKDTLAKRAILFIEGDGAAWIDRGLMPPDNPTPKNSLSLRLALESRNRSDLTLIYVGRPCQFKSAEELAQCSTEQWSTERYSDTQVAIIQSALSLALTNATATVGEISSLQIIGHSGGGVIGVKIAADRMRKNQQFNKLYALASPIDPITWRKNHRLHELSIGAYYQDLRLVNENNRIRIYVGVHDRIVREDDISTDLVSLRKKSILVPATGHISGWSDYWKYTLLPYITNYEHKTE